MHGDVQRPRSIPIINNTGTTRYCVTAHLCAAKDANGNIIFPATDVVIGDIPANFNGTKDVTIPGVSVRRGPALLRRTRAGSSDCSFQGCQLPDRGVLLDDLVDVKASRPRPDTTRQISSKCRHQQICIQGRGISARLRHDYGRRADRRAQWPAAVPPT